MTQIEYTYKRQGVTQAYLNSVMPGTGTVGEQIPAAYLPVTWDSSVKADLDQIMASQGWEFLWEGPPPPAKAISAIEANALASDGSPVFAAAGWTDVPGLAVIVETRGGSSVGVTVAVVAAWTVAMAHARLLVDGGEFEDVILGAEEYCIPENDGTAVAGFHVTTMIPATDAPVEYTFRIQVRAGPSGDVTPNKGSILTAFEYR